MFLSIVIPVYNEEKNIREVLDEHITYLKDVEQWEIVCLDDASTDGTWKLLEAYAGQQPRLRLLRHEINQGISPSFQRLFEEARGEYIYLTAGDGQWPAENLTRLLKTYQDTQADLVIGVGTRWSDFTTASRSAFGVFSLTGRSPAFSLAISR